MIAMSPLEEHSVKFTQIRLGPLKRRVMLSFSSLWVRCYSLKMILESGYNLHPRSWRRSHLDEFYIELPRVIESRSLSDELWTSLSELQSKQMYALIDDGSPLAQALRGQIPERIFPSRLESSPERTKFQKDIYSRFGVWRREHVLALTLAFELQRPLLLPSCSGRIINYNYRRVSQKEVGRPYWVFAYPESTHKAQLAAQELGLSITFDIFQAAPRLMRSYFLHPLHFEMYQAATFPYPHNDQVERRIWLGLVKGAADPYPPPVEFNFEKQKPSFEQSAHIPMHTLIKKYFGAEVDINKCEIEIYGETD